MTAVTGGVHAQIARTFEQAPLGVVGVMVPLPLHTPLVVAETVGGGQIGLGILYVANIRFGIGTCVLAVGADDGPVVAPCYRQQIRHTSVRAAVAHQHGPPVSTLCLNHRTLVDIVAVKHLELFIRSERTGRTEAPLCGWP